MMFRPADNIKETIQLFIGLSLVEFHRAIDKNSLHDDVNESLIREIMEVMDIQSEFFLRVFKAASYLKFPLNLVSPSDLKLVLMSTHEEVDKFAKDQFSLELDKIFCKREHKSIQLLEFFQTPSFSEIKVQKKFITLLAYI